MNCTSSAAKPNFDNIILSGANADDHYLRQLDRDREFCQEIFVGDLMEGYPEIPSNAYNVVTCEQVLEHLEHLPVAIATLARVARPGGKVIIGVPIFPPPLHLVRRKIVPKFDAWLGQRKKRGHVQAFSLHSLLYEITDPSKLPLIKMRGFRFVSGGPLRPLDDHFWWWLNH
jgi:SAM-dependent methyltransferase